ncbi:nuclear transport factor 2 family protein [Actinomadura logoneensis]|uniref:Nuclear transport factor 2 family protein n=1 Tax=Actinomadura logoneensis TaxID=2293572 RepID=A0A372JVR4_9ACTN|nr:nuclear transport factor 2 family protein [Actinomadura logoneensis]RFU43428.1 nuclear transport factor 2 family protein [Actinomadura logoneensis]
MSERRPPVPPFTAETAAQKVRAAENAWNTRDPERIAAAYSPDSRWRNRSEFVNGRAEIVAFLTRKWKRELDYRLIKELWAYGENRIAVRFAYEWHDDSGQWFRSYGNENWEFDADGLMNDDSGQWFRSYGNENWEFDADGLMTERHASINDVPIAEADRLFHWPADAPRPASHPTLSALGL